MTEALPTDHLTMRTTLSWGNHLLGTGLSPQATGISAQWLCKVWLKVMTTTPQSKIVHAYFSLLEQAFLYSDQSSCLVPKDGDASSPSSQNIHFIKNPFSAFSSSLLFTVFGASSQTWHTGPCHLRPRTPVTYTCIKASHFTHRDT